MKRIKFTTGDVILMTIYGLALSSNVVTCFFSKQGELHHYINQAIWVLATAGWFFLYKMISSRNDRMIEAGNKTSSEVGQKAVNSAPSNLNTYEKGVYEEGFKDGVNFIKNEMNSAL